MPWPRTSSRATPSMAGCEKPSVKPKCSRCLPSSPAGCDVGQLEPAVRARAARAPSVPASASSASALCGVDDDEDLEVAQVVLPRGGVVAEALGARRHALAQLPREAVEDPCRQLERGERAIGERDVERRLGVARPLLLGRHRVGERGQEGARASAARARGRRGGGRSRSACRSRGRSRPGGRRRRSPGPPGGLERRVVEDRRLRGERRDTRAQRERRRPPPRRSRAASRRPRSRRAARAPAPSARPRPGRRPRARTRSGPSAGASSRAAAASHGSTGPSWSAASST